MHLPAWAGEHAIAFLQGVALFQEAFLSSCRNLVAIADNQRNLAHGLRRSDNHSDAEKKRNQTQQL